nr:class I SAM-dependent methyltransferase [Bacteriovorax sp. HI3]
MTDLSSLEEFNRYYSTGGNPPVTRSLLDFFRTCVKERMPEKARILELGSGTRSLFEEVSLPRERVTAIDFSSVAIERAKALGSPIEYKNLDITFPDALEGEKFDVIFDSHCLHCIDNRAARVSAFKNIHDALTEEGIFCAEMMVQPAHNSVSFPMKFIPTARELEEEILKHDFQIVYFMIGRGLSFENGNQECDLLRVIAKRKVSA